MKLRRAIATTVVAATALVGGLALAPKADALGPPTVSVKSITLVDRGRKIEIVADYRCSGQHNDLTHLWVSVKQGGPDPTAEGSGETVDSWYDNHPVDAIQCNSKHHLAKFYALWHSDKKKATIGAPSWVQFCLFDKDGTLGYDYDWFTLQSN